MVYNGKPYLNGWFGGTPIFGNTYIQFGSPSNFDPIKEPAIFLSEMDMALQKNGQFKFC